MVDLALTPEQELLRASARDFVERECPPAEVRRIDEAGGFSPELWRKMAEIGWAGILVPTEHGGEGATLTDAAVLYEELGRGLVPSPHHASAVIGALLIERAASAVQRARMLPAIARGETKLAFALTEERYGWSPEHVSTTATPKGHGFGLRGTKRLVPDAGTADELIVVARDSAGTSVFLVPCDAVGVTIEPMRGFVGESLFAVTLDNVEVGADRLLGERGRAWDILTPVLDIATALLCVFVAGAMRRAYEITLQYAQQRVQFGQPIARFQRVQDHLIDMLNHADAAHWTAYEAVWKLEQGKPDAQAAVSVAKIVASEGFYDLCESAHHVHGGIGADKAYGLYLYTKKSRSFYHYLGDLAFHRGRLARLLDL